MNDDNHEKYVEANIKMGEKLKISPTQKLVEEVYDKIEKSRRIIMNPRKPRLPKKLVILSVEWDISYFDKQIQVDADGKEQLFGQVNYEDNSIRIFRGKRKRECIFETIFHEWLHVVTTEFGYRDILGNKEEQFTEAISTALNDLFWRNFNGR